MGFYLASHNNDNDTDDDDDDDEDDDADDKNAGLKAGFEPMTSAIPLQCSTY